MTSTSKAFTSSPLPSSLWLVESSGFVTHAFQSPTQVRPIKKTGRSGTRWENSLLKVMLFAFRFWFGHPLRLCSWYCQRSHHCDIHILWDHICLIMFMGPCSLDWLTGLTEAVIGKPYLWSWNWTCGKSCLCDCVLRWCLFLEYTTPMYSVPTPNMSNNIDVQHATKKWLCTELTLTCKAVLWATSLIQTPQP